MKKIGFFGGTFNPIHIGHLRIAFEVYEHFSMDSVHFVPAPLPPHKKVVGLLDYHTRAKLIELSFEELGFDNFLVSDHENFMSGPSYSYESLQIWQKIHECTPYFILGLEDFVQLHTWHKGLELPKFTNFIVVKRAHFSPKEYHETIHNYWGNKTEKLSDSTYALMGNTIEYFETTRLDISSTKIRKLFCTKKNPVGLVTKNVQSHIENNANILEKWKESMDNKM